MLVLSLILAPSALADRREGETFIITIDDLHPTQFAVGEAEVQYRKKQLAGNVSKNKPWSPDKGGDAIEVALAPNGRIYVINGHHHLKALDELGVKEVEVLVHRDWSKLTGGMQNFWKKMEAEKLFWAKSETGAPRSVRTLPNHVRDLKNDPFRSIAWYVKKSGAYEETHKPFVEFRWAQYFREHLSAHNLEDPKEFRAAVEEAIHLSRKNLASGLPGFHRFKKHRCGDYYAEIERILPKRRSDLN